MAYGQGSLLLSVIRDLLDSFDEDERESQRDKLRLDKENAHEELDKLVHSHQSKLQDTLDTYTRVDARITASQQKIQELKGKISSCKTLLKCRQEDLKSLWLENVKYKEVLKLFDVINKVRTVPDEVKQFKERKHYLHASESLVNAIKLVTGKLANIEALKELRVELMSIREGLYQHLMEELREHLYVKPKPKPKKKLEEKKDSSPAVQPKRVTLTRHTRTLSRTLQMEQETTQQVALPRARFPIKNETIVEDITLLEPDANSPYFMDILVESLQNLGHTEHAVNDIQQQMEREFLLIIEKLSYQVIKSAEHHGWHQHKAKLLVTLLELIFDKFRAVVDAHALVLASFQRVKRCYVLTTCELYSEADIWTVIQQVLQQVLSEYLAMGKASETGIGPSMSDVGDLASFFTRKKWPTGRSKPSYFRFEGSEHAVSSMLRDDQARGSEDVDGKSEDKEEEFDRHPDIPLVCPPSTFNVTKTFAIICEFATEIESAMRLASQEECPLRRFIVSFTANKFIDDINRNFQEKLDSATNAENIFKLIDAKQLKAFGLQKHIFACAVTIWTIEDHLRKLVSDLPSYANSFLEFMIKFLKEFHQSMSIMYKNLVTTQTGSHLQLPTLSVATASAKFIQEEKNRQLLKSLPSWRLITSLERTGKPSSGSLPNEEKDLFCEESTHFLKTFAGDHVKESRLVTNHTDLQRVALLHESMEWLCQMIVNIIMDLTKNGIDGSNKDFESPELTNERDKKALDLLQELSKVSAECRNLTESSILVLHVEVRVHCFCHLERAISSSSLSNGLNVNDLDVGVDRLKRDLKGLEETLNFLTEPKFKYVFEGVGHLLATIFIRSAEMFHQINQTGIKKMCRYISTLQQELATKTQMRETDMDRSKQYFGLLHLNIQEVLKLIQEQGRVFTLEEYTTVIRLIVGNIHKKEQLLASYIKQLQEMFADDAV